MSKTSLVVGNHEFFDIKDFFQYVASVEDLKQLKAELKQFDHFVLRDIYEKLSKKTDKKKLTKGQWIEAIYQTNH